MTNDVERERRRLWLWVGWLVLSAIAEVAVYVAAHWWFFLVQGGHWLAALGVAYHLGHYRGLKRPQPMTTPEEQRP